MDLLDWLVTEQMWETCTYNTPLGTAGTSCELEVGAVVTAASGPVFSPQPYKHDRTLQAQMDKQRDKSNSQMFPTDRKGKGNVLTIQK